MKKQVLGTILIAVVWLGLSICCLIRPEVDESLSERRKLAQFPEMTKKTLLDGSFMADFETYTLDQFPMRDSFRTMKAVMCYYAFAQTDNNGIYVADGYAASTEYPLNEASVFRATQKIRDIYTKCIEGKCENVYVAVVPDKGYFLAESNGVLSMDYERAFSIVREQTLFAEYIDLSDGLLAVEDYYKTDTHWRQECIIPVANALSQAMSGATITEEQFITVDAGVEFYGVYYGQAALPMRSERLNYLTNPVLAACKVYNYETEQTTGLYDMEKLHSRDPYEMFLSGAAPLLVIENGSATTERELVVFRDSFGSSLVPLMVEQYAKITLIDTRYMPSAAIESYVDFNGQDVLFLYSTILLNNSMSLK